MYKSHVGIFKMQFFTYELSNNANDGSITPTLNPLVLL